MKEKPQVKVYPMRYSASDWRVEFADGKYICDIRVALSSIPNASRYYVLMSGEVAKEGTFSFSAWDAEAVEELLTAVVRSMYAAAQVSVEPAPSRRAINA
ncbi:MAG: hypothetical protein HY908_30400 [Myxococcales bacterium]|nr:hypothetical protein [Myxococcales bacterium]